MTQEVSPGGAWGRRASGQWVGESERPHLTHTESQRLATPAMSMEVEMFQEMELPRIFMAGRENDWILAFPYKIISERRVVALQ